MGSKYYFLFRYLLHLYVLCNHSIFAAVVNKKALIVGAGPVGLAAALMLKRRGWKEVVVVERRENFSIDQQRAYLYLIDGRGQRCTDLLGITYKINENSVRSSQAFQALQEVLTNGVVNEKKLPVIANTGVEKYWVSRSVLLDIFLKEIQSNNIHIILNSTFTSIESNVNGTFTVSIMNNTIISSNESTIFTPNLILGCDGYKSNVREWLQENDSTINKNKFDMESFPSDAAGLNYKILNINPRFPLPNSTMTKSTSVPSNNHSEIVVYSNPSKVYAIRGTKGPESSVLSLGLLPVPDVPTAVRTANIIRKPNHLIWKQNTLEDVKRFLHSSFPQINLETFVSDEELSRFAAAKCGEFPVPQVCKSMVAAFGPSAGIGLAGDAVHVFPPDLGQGVNSGLEDVFSLHQALETCGDEDVSNALRQYERDRLPQAQALVRIMQFGAPYQYKQSVVRERLWTANFLLRLLLSKALPFVFAPPAFLMVQDHTVPYTSILSRVHSTTTKIITLTSLLVAVVVRQRFGANVVVSVAFSILSALVASILSRILIPSKWRSIVGVK